MLAFGYGLATVGLELGTWNLKPSCAQAERGERLVVVGAGVAAALGEGAGGYRAVEAAAEGDGLHGGGVGEGQRLAVEGAAGAGGAAVGGVADFRSALGAHGHRGALGEGGAAADGGRVDRRGAAAAGATRARVAVAARGRAVTSHGEGCADGGREGEAGGRHTAQVEHESLGVGARLSEGSPGVLRLGLEDDAVGEDLQRVAAFVGRFADADGRAGVEGRRVAPQAGAQVVHHDGLRDGFALGGTAEGGGELAGVARDLHRDGLSVAGVVHQVQVVLQGGLAAVGVDEDAVQQTLDEGAAVGLAEAVGDEAGAPHLAEHTGHLSGQLHLGTLAHLGVGAGVADCGGLLLEDDTALGALLTHGVAGLADILDKRNDFCHCVFPFFLIMVCKTLVWFRTRRAAPWWAAFFVSDPLTGIGFLDRRLLAPDCPLEFSCKNTKTF